MSNPASMALDKALIGVISDFLNKSLLPGEERLTAKADVLGSKARYRRPSRKRGQRLSVKYNDPAHRF